jgi:hypothetical protein
MTAREKLAAAERATTKARTMTRYALAALDLIEGPNALGIYPDAFGASGMLCAAISHLQAARAAIDGIEWPRDADYDEAEREGVKE